jgi:hypothetical protein
MTWLAALFLFLPSPVKKLAAYAGILAVSCVLCYGCGRVDSFREREGLLERLRNRRCSGETLPANTLENP